jgi:radical SAM protein with 4Fe4S-binding SPASM domain
MIAEDKVHKNVEMFCVDGISMLGNFDNGALIGVDSKGEKYLKKSFPYIEKPQDKDEEMIYGALSDLSFFKESPKQINAAYVHVTDRCNLHCIGCYSYVDNRNQKLEMSYSEICHTLDCLREAGCTKLVFSGGEPFLRNDMTDILQYAKETCGFEQVTVITNGTLPIQRYEKAASYLNEISVSVDGYDDKTQFIRDAGIMPLVLEHIKKLRQLMKVHLIFTLHRRNMCFMQEYCDLADELGCTYNFSIFTVEAGCRDSEGFQFDKGSLKEVSDRLSSIEQSIQIADTPMDGSGMNCRNICEAGTKLVSIAANGDVYPCHMLMRKEFLLGNLLKEDKNRSLLEMVYSGQNSFLGLDCSKLKKCASCKFSKLCGGGCRGRSFLKYGDLSHEDSYCTFIYSYYQQMMDDLRMKCRAR